MSRGDIARGHLFKPSECCPEDRSRMNSSQEGAEYKGKCKNIGCPRERQYYKPFVWDCCCKQCFMYDGHAHDKECDQRTMGPASPGTPGGFGAGGGGSAFGAGGGGSAFGAGGGLQTFEAAPSTTTFLCPRYARRTPTTEGVQRGGGAGCAEPQDPSTSLDRQFAALFPDDLKSRVVAGHRDQGGRPVNLRAVDDGPNCVCGRSRARGSGFLHERCCSHCQSGCHTRGCRRRERGRQ